MSGEQSLGNLTVTLSADPKHLKDGAHEAQNALNELRESAKHVLEVLGVIEAIHFGYEFIKETMEAIDQQSKLAFRLQGTVAGLQTLEYAAKLAGVPVEAMTTAVSKMDVALSQASTNIDSKAAVALQKLKLNAADLLKLDIDKRMQALAQRMYEMGYSVAQQGEVLKAFNIRGQDMVALFERGGKIIAEAQHQAHEYGLTLSQVDAAKVEIANEAWIKAGAILDAFKNQTMVAIAPLVAAAGEEFAKLAKSAGGVGPMVTNAMRVSIVAVGAFIDAVKVAAAEVMKLWDNAKNALGAVGVVVEFLTGSVAGAGKAIAVLNSNLKGTNAEKDKLGEAPHKSSLVEWFDEIVSHVTHEAEELVANRDKILNAKPAKIDRFSAEQRKALQDRLDNLKKEISSEDIALEAQRNKQRNEDDALMRKGFITKQQNAELKLQIDANYEKKKKELVQSLLEETILHEDELNQRAYDKRLKELALFEAHRTITVENAANIRTKLEQKHAIDLAQIASQAYSKLAGIVDTALGQIAQAVGTQGGAAFQVMKAISYATALVKGYEAVVSAYAAGAKVGGPALGAAFAAIAAAGVAGQIAAIAKTQPTGGATAAPTAPAAAGGDVAATGGGGGASAGQTLSIQGLHPSSLYTGDAVRTLANSLMQFQRDGGKVIYEK